MAIAATLALPVWPCRDKLRSVSHVMDAYALQWRRPAITAWRRIWFQEPYLGRMDGAKCRDSPDVERYMCNK
eukprot:365378-Chlamydomonas_euryale.AAC.5